MTAFACVAHCLYWRRLDFAKIKLFGMCWLTTSYWRAVVVWIGLCLCKLLEIDKLNDDDSNWSGQNPIFTYNRTLCLFLDPSFRFAEAEARAGQGQSGLRGATVSIVRRDEAIFCTAVTADF